MCLASKGARATKGLPLCSACITWIWKNRIKYAPASAVDKSALIFMV